MESLSQVSLGTIEKVIAHPDADRLDIVEVWGCPCIVGKDEFKAGEQVVFIPFDFVIPEDASYLPEKLRGRKVKPAKLRGVFSMGLVVKNAWGFTEADDIGEKLGIEKWLPPCERVGHEKTNSPVFDEAKPPRGIVIRKYDLQSLRQYKNELRMMEQVVITEKLHGACSSYVFQDGRLHVGSRNHWLKEENGGQWWQVAHDLGLSDILSNIPGVVVFGELFGNVQDLKYGADKGELKFAAFDMFDSQKGIFYDYDIFSQICGRIGIELVPLLYNGPWLGFEHHQELAEGKSTLADHVREGFVVKPFYERVDHKFNRVAYKLHGAGFLCRREKS